MDDNESPTMIVSTDDVRVSVNDRMTAEIALEIVDAVLPFYLGETTHVDRRVPEPDHSRSPVKVRYDAKCPQCGHDWRRFAEDDMRATCPECSHSWGHNIPGRERDDAEVVG